MKDLGIQKGTKLTDKPKDKILRVRIDDETEKKLTEICESENKSKSDVVRTGIELQYAKIKK